MVEESNKRLGFGWMRLPTTDGKNDIDQELLCRMTDEFIKNGFFYFDTAYPYHNGKSELMIRECLVKRYPRNRFVLADKIAPCFVKDEADLERIFQEQLEKCQVEYFDVFLLHNLGASFYEMAKKQNAFSFLKKKKREGKIKKIGFSFHDTPKLLEKILIENPDVDVVQIQLNYYDWDNPAIRSSECYQVLEKYNKDVIVMEPVKGGGLARLPDEAVREFAKIGNKSNTSYALRFAAMHPKVVMVLSGMNTMEQLYDNMATMDHPEQLNEIELNAVERVKEILHSKGTISCTGCGYCISGCPAKIPIPNLFSIYNQEAVFGTDNFPSMHYQKNTTEQGLGKAGDCIGCGSCESICPQHLKIREKLVTVAKKYE